MYRSEASRKNLKAQVTDMESYYFSLEMVIKIQFADEFAIPRIAQQTQKTNQFNVTTRRYSDADIKELLESENSDVIYVKLSDIFGDSGIVGACILRYDGSTVLVDTLLLSCRVLGRKVEDILINQVLELAKKKGFKTVVGEYYPTNRNQQVEFFFTEHNFEEIQSNQGTAGRKFIFNLDKKFHPVPQYFKSINSQIV